MGLTIYGVARTWFLSVLCLATAFACAGKVAPPGGGGNPLGGPSGGAFGAGVPIDPSGSACPDLLEEGRKVFQGCAACHGADARSAMFKAIDLDADSYRHSTMSVDAPSLSLPEYISSYMPQPGACKGACADSVAAYVRSLGGQAWCPDAPSGSEDRVIAMQALHRLSTFQHNRLIQSIVGIDYDVSSQLPKDSAVGGFDNAAEGLTLASDTVSLYLAVTDDIVEQAFTAPGELNATLNPTGCDASDEGCARDIARYLGVRAFRRSPNNPDVEPYLTLFDELKVKGAFVALKGAAKAILMSPRFLFNATRTTDIQGEMLNPYVVANRLSFFLWATGPDQQLLDLAESGALLQDQVLAQQAERMLKDSRTDGFMDGFVGTWLSLDRLRYAPDEMQEFPLYNKDVKDALAEETQLFIHEFMQSDVSVTQMVNPSFGYLNDVLASHYGLPLPGSSEMVKVPKGSGERRGVFHLGAWHLAESDGAETNPIRRGAWVLDQLLCTPMGAPPPDAATTLPEIEGQNLTIRERLDLHRTNATCATCHNFIDPAGLGFEAFNAVGAHDPTQLSDGKFPGGIEFDNPLQIPDLMSKSRQVSDCLTRKLYRYAHARQLTDADAVFLRDILGNLSGQESLTQVVSSLVASPTFRNSPSLEVLNAGPLGGN